MATLKPKLARLSSASEEQLLLASLPSNIKQLSTRQLKTDIGRARKLRNKYRTLSRQQAGERRGKRAPRATRPAGRGVNTVVKAKAFEKALLRFETQLAARRAPKAKVQPKKPTRTRSAARPKTPRGKARRRTRTAALQLKSEATRGKRNTRKMQQMNLKRSQAFISSRSRKSTAARDRR